MASKLAMASERAVNTRRGFLSRGVAARLGIGAGGKCPRLLSAFTPDPRPPPAGPKLRPYPAISTSFAARTQALPARRLCRSVSLVNDGPQAVWIGGMNVFNNTGEIVTVGGQYQDRLGVERNTLRFQPGMAQANIAMRPGQMQLWHIVNESPGVSLEFQPFAAGSGFSKWSRTAGDDDVPLVWGKLLEALEPKRCTFSLGPANRADLLVRAPSAHREPMRSTSPLAFR